MIKLLFFLWLLTGTSNAFQMPHFRSSFVKASRVSKVRSSWLFSTLDTRSMGKDPASIETEDNVGAWIPIASVHALRGLGPQKIRVMGLDLVVWESEDIWSVMADTCPHRFAPLSQGRVDPETGCIECPYHGWQFDAEGNLTALPHAEPDIDIRNIPGSQASYFPTHLAGDLIFAFLPSSIHGEMFLQSTLPEDMFPTVREDMAKNRTFFVRELPYSADFLIENFMDPSHIPYAHHSLQSTRSDATPIPTTIVVSNFTHVETTFEDKSRGVKREGVTSFQRPTMYHFRIRRNNSEPYKTGLNIHIVPVEAGKSRVLFAAIPLDWLPNFLKHAASNQFLNTDVWLHNAEYEVRKRSSKYNPYVYASNSDLSVRAFRQWWSKHGFSTSPPNTFGPAAFESLNLLNREAQIDPWQHHSRQCSSCRKALKILKRIKTGSLIASVVSVVLLRRWRIPALLVVALNFGVRHMATLLSTVIEGNPYPSGYNDRSKAHEQDYDQVVMRRRLISKK